MITVRILGCGSSGGVPRPGLGWGACDPRNPRNRRRRCSILLTRGEGAETTTVLVDTTPDLREQLLDAAVTRIDAVLYTHAHADHLHGIDDLRPMVIHMRRRISVHADAPTRARMEAGFGYVFRSPPGSQYPPILDLHDLPVDGSELVIDGPGGSIAAMPFRVEHGNEPALGFRFGGFAYVPDLSLMPDAAKARLRGLDLLVVDALRDTPHPTHFSVADALGLIAELAPRRAILTNMHTDLDYDALAARLPPNVVPAFDGLSVTAAFQP